MIALQLDLYKDIDEGTSKATVLPGMVSIKARKKEKGLWGQLKAAGDAASVKERREASIREKSIRDARRYEDNKEKKRQDDDYVFHKQWDLEKDEKRVIERLAELHKKDAEKQLYEWVETKEAKEAKEAGEEEPVSTYFDKQLVEGDVNPFEEKDGLIPLPGSYHKKTARSSAMANSLKAEPVPEFDIRKKEDESAGGRSEGKEKRTQIEEVVEEEEEEEEEVQKEKEHKRLEAERVMPLTVTHKEKTAQKDSNKNEGEGEDTRSEAGRTAAENVHVSTKKEDGEEEDKQDESASGHDNSANRSETSQTSVTDEEKLLGRRKGASLNRWDAEAVAQKHRMIGDAYFKAGMVEDAKRHEALAREAAPWVEDQLRTYETREVSPGRRSSLR
eukprot:57676-Hanusia_phi.AAC.3